MSKAEETLIDCQATKVYSLNTESEEKENEEKENEQL